MANWYANYDDADWRRFAARMNRPRDHERGTTMALTPAQADRIVRALRGHKERTEAMIIEFMVNYQDSAAIPLLQEEVRETEATIEAFLIEQAELAVASR